jgi:hypothetical protein
VKLVVPLILIIPLARALIILVVKALITLVAGALIFLVRALMPLVKTLITLLY